MGSGLIWRNRRLKTQWHLTGLSLLGKCWNYVIKELLSNQVDWQLQLLPVFFVHFFPSTLPCLCPPVQCAEKAQSKSACHTRHSATSFCPVQTKGLFRLGHTAEGRMWNLRGGGEGIREQSWWGLDSLAGPLGELHARGAAVCLWIRRFLCVQFILISEAKGE